MRQSQESGRGAGRPACAAVGDRGIRRRGLAIHRRPAAMGQGTGLGRSAPARLVRAVSMRVLEPRQAPGAGGQGTRSALNRLRYAYSIRPSAGPVAWRIVVADPNLVSSLLRARASDFI